MGVNALGDSAVTLRVRVRTIAGFQWGVRREYLRRIKLRFDEVGIEIPFPHMTVWFGEMKGNVPPPVAHVRIDTGTIAQSEPAGEDETLAATAAPEADPLAPPGEDQRT